MNAKAGTAQCEGLAEQKLPDRNAGAQRRGVGRA